MNQIVKKFNPKTPLKRDLKYMNPEGLKFPIHISPSQLNNFQSCRYLSYLKRLGWSKVSVSDALHFGRLIDKSLEYLYLELSRKKLNGEFKPQAIRSSIIELLTKKKVNSAIFFSRKLVPAQQIKEFTDRYKFDPFDYSFLEVWEKMYSQRSSEVNDATLQDHLLYALSLLPEYFVYHQDIFNGNFKIQYTQESLNVSFEQEVILHGRMDAIVSVKSKDKKSFNYVLENKTSSQFDEEKISFLGLMAMQNKFYYYACNLVDPGSVHGLFFNFVRRPKIRLKKNESENQFIERLQNEIQTKPEYYFKRMKITYTESDMKEFELELRQKIKDYKSFLKGNLPILKNDTGNICYGVYKCEFLEHCYAKDDISNNVLYTIKPFEA